MSVWNVDLWRRRPPGRTEVDAGSTRVPGRAELRRDEADLRPRANPAGLRAMRIRRDSHPGTARSSVLDFALFPHGWVAYLIPSEPSAPELR